MSKLHAIQRDAVRGSELIAKLDRAYNLASHNEHLREFAADELSNDPGGLFITRDSSATEESFLFRRSSQGSFIKISHKLIFLFSLNINLLVQVIFDRLRSNIFFLATVFLNMLL